MAKIGFKKRIKVAPGVHVNVGKKGMSMSAGVKGARVGVNSRGVYTSTSLPGTGISNRTYHSRTSQKISSTDKSFDPPSVITDPVSDISNQLQQAHSMGERAAYEQARRRQIKNLPWLIWGGRPALILAFLVFFANIPLGLALIAYGLPVWLLNSKRTKRGKDKLIASLTKLQEQILDHVNKDKDRARKIEKYLENEQLSLSEIKVDDIILDDGEKALYRIADAASVKQKDEVLLVGDSGVFVLTNKQAILMNTNGSTAVNLKRLIAVDTSLNTIVRMTLKNRKTPILFYLPGYCATASALIKGVASKAVSVN